MVDHPPSSQENAAAFEQLRGELASIGPQQLRSFRGLTPRRAALASWRIARESQAPELAKRFEALASIGELPDGATERLASIAQAVLHIERQSKQHDAVISTARVPADKVEQGFAVRGRMLGVLAYVYEPHDKNISKQLEVIRQGAGHLDLAEDLTDLADLYKAQEADLKSDGGKHHRASDEAEARKLSDEILDHLTGAAPGSHREWSTLRRQAMTLLQNVYDEVKAAGRLFFRHDDPEAHYPSLQVIARADRKASSEDAEDEQDAAPAPAPGG